MPEYSKRPTCGAATLLDTSREVLARPSPIAGKKPPGDGEKSLFLKLFWLHLEAAGWWATEDLYTFLYTRVRRCSSRVDGRTPSASRRPPFFALSGEIRFVFTPVLKRSPTTTSGSAPAAQWGQRRRREALAFWTEERPHSSTTPHASSRKKASDVL